MTHFRDPAAPLAAPTAQRLPTLDGVRGLAILLVVTHNLNLLTEPAGLGSRLVAVFLEHGWIGVQLFFVLSGFLITGILIDTRRDPHHYASFFGARMFRILPLYYVTLLVVFGVLPLLQIGLGAHGASTVWPLALFVSNWVQPFQPGASPLPHFWSLAVEEQFYLLWPFLIRHLNLKGVFKLCVGLTVVALGVRLALIHFQWPQAAVYEFSISRMDALACGAAAAALLRMPACRAWLLAHSGRLMVAAGVVLLGGAAVTGGYPQYAFGTQTLGYLCLSVAFALFVLALASADLGGASSRWAAPLRHALLRRLGLYSYAMYVLHVPLHAIVGVPLMRAWGLHDPSGLWVSVVYILAGTALVFGVGALSYRHFESYFALMKHRFRRTLGNPPVAAGA